MPPAINNLSYEEFYEKQLWEEQYLRQKAKLASTTLPIAVALGKGYQAVETVLTRGLMKSASGQAQVSEALQDILVGASTAVKDTYYEALKAKGLDNIDIETLKNIAKIYTDHADNIRATILTKEQYEIQKNSLNDEAWSNYYEGKALSHIYQLYDYLEEARQTEANYEVTVDALQAHNNAYNVSDGATEEISIQKHGVLGEYAQNLEGITNRVTVIENVLKNALLEFQQWEDEGNWFLPHVTDWQNLDDTLSNYPALALPHLQEIRDYKVEHPLFFTNENALSEILISALDTQLSVFKKFMEEGGSGLADFLRENSSAQDSFSVSQSPEFIAMHSQSGFPLDQILDGALSNLFGDDYLDEMYDSFINLQSAFTDWWDELSIGESTSATGSIDYAAIGSNEIDIFNGDAGADKFYGLGGDDTIYGGEGRDHIEGNADNDTLHGDAGTDYLYGGKGDDHLHGGADNDFLIGGEGSDTYYYVNGDGHDSINDVDAGDRLNINDKLITAITPHSTDANLYEDEHGNTYLLGATGGMLITVSEGTQSGTITIDVFDADTNNFGITINEPEEPIAPELFDDVLTVGGGSLGEVRIKDDYYDRESDPEQSYLNDQSIIYDATLATNFRPYDDPSKDYHFDGGNQNDELTGGSLMDVLTGFAGDDVINGMEGDDELRGGAGNDQIKGGEGNDFIFGNQQPFVDELGNPIGAYQVELAESQDILDGGSGNDHISADGGNDIVTGGAGHDYIAGGLGSDTLMGGAGSDFILGDSQRERIAISSGIASTKIHYIDIKEEGQTYDDVIDGGEGEDTVLGGIGNDTIMGGSGDDWIHGDRHNDAHRLLIGDQIDQEFSLLDPELHGDDVIFGGSGEDDISGDAGDDYLDGGTGNDNIFGDDFYIDGEHHGKDVLVGGAGNDFAIGGGNDDVIYGGDGSDSLVGDETIYEGETEILLEGQYHGKDEIHGGVGADKIVGGGNDDVLYGDQGNDIIWGDSQFDSGQGIVHAGITAPISGGDYWLDKIHHGQDQIFAGAGDDIVYGGGGSDTVYGGTGSDLIFGDEGDDTLYGGSGNDILYGGAGEDTLHAGSGQDYMDGGAGEDTYVFNAGNGSSTIDDADGRNTIVFSSINDASEIKVYSGEEYSVVQYGQDVNDKVFLTNETFLNLSGISLGDGSTLDSNPIQIVAIDESRKISGTNGNDTFLMNAGFGFLTLVNNGDTSTTDALKFGADITSDNIGLSYNYGLTGDPEHANPDYHSVSIHLESGDTLNLENFIQNNGDAAIDHFEFASGEVWSFSDFTQQLFTVTDSNNAIHGSPWDEVLTGGERNDYLYADKGDDTIRGGEGRDTLDAGEGDDVLDGGVGNDVLIGGLGDDRYRFGVNHGQDEIQLDNDANGYETIEFDESITVDQVYFTRRENSLLVHTGFSDHITIANAFDGNDYLASAIDEIRFDDGTIWNAGQVVAMLNQGTQFNDALNGSSLVDEIYGFAGHDTITGKGGDDTLHGGEGRDELDGGTGNDILVGGKGTDYLRGGAGEDTYQYALGDGSDYIIREADDTSSDILQMMPGIAPEDVQLLRTGLALRVFIESTDSSIYVNHFFESINRSQPIVSEIVFDDGTRWVAADIFEQLDSSTEGNDERYGDSGDNFIEGLGGDDILYGGDGNDTIEGGSGNDIIEGEDGNDVLLGGEGRDQVIGGAGDDVLSGGFGGQGVFITDYDSLKGGHGNDTYIFNLGDGAVSVNQKGALDSDFDVIRFGENIRPEDVDLITDYASYGYALGINGEDVWGGDHLWILENGLSSNGVGYQSAEYRENLSLSTIDEIQFEDGTVWDKKFIQTNLFTSTERSNYIVGSDEADIIDGLAGNDEIRGGDGADNLNGGEGNDSLYGHSGDDTLIAGAGNDNIVGGTGNDSIIARQGDNEIRFSLGDGQDVIEVGHDDGGVTQLGFQSNIASSSLTYQLNGRDLVISIEGTQDSVTLKEYLTENLLNITNDYALFEVRFSDESIVLGAEDLSTLTVIPYENHVPVVSQALADILSSQGELVYFTLPANSFTDAGDSLTYSASLSDNAPLPSWLSFDVATQTFSGTPGAGDIGVLSLKVTATDNDAAAISDVFDLTVNNVNDAPTINQGIAEITVAEDTALNLAIPADAFSDLDGDTLSYTASLVGGADLPTWLSFDGTAFSGTPDNNELGSLAIEVLASDGLATVAVNFTLSIDNTNDAPSLSLALIDQNVTSGEILSFGIPEGSFSDIDTGDVLSYTASLSDNAPLPSWLSFDAATQTFSGMPGESEVGSLNLKVTATDTAGTSVSDVFEVSITSSVIAAPIAASEAVTFVGTNADEIIGGSDFVDSLDGQQGNDTLYGFDGDDELKGYSGDDRIIGGIGNDILNGSVGSDTFVFNLGDGQDTISEYRSGNDVNVIEFGEGITSDDLNFQKSSNGLSLEIVVGGGGDLITLQYFYYSPDDLNNTLINEMHFNDGTVLSQVDLIALIPALVTEENDWINGDDGNNTIAGLGGNDVIFSKVGDDTLEGGAGNDQLYGDAGNDTYVYNTGDGNDVISDTKGINSLVIDGQTISQITPISVGSTRYQDAAGNQYEVNSNGWLIVTVGSDASAGRISIIGWDQDTNNFGVSMQELDNQSPEAIDDAGTSNENTPLIITVADLLSNDSDPEGDVLTITAASNALNGVVVLDDAAGNITFTPDAGYTGPASFDYTLSDGELTDTGTVDITVVTANTAPDILLALADQTGDEGQAISFSLPVGSFADMDTGDSLSYTATLTDGSALPSWLSFDANTQTFSGMPISGDSGTLSLEVTATDLAGASVSDVFELMISEADTEDDGSNISAELVNYVGTSEDEVIYGSDFNDTVDGQFGDDTLYGYDGADDLKGYFGNDRLIGGTGNDTLSGLFGSDTYVFNLGDGQDTISEYGSESDVNVIEFGAGILPEDLIFQKSSNGTNLEIVVGEAGDLISLTSFYSSSSYSPSKPFISEIHFENGTVFTQADLVTLFPTAVTEENDWINGDDGNNTIAGLAGNDVIFSRAGDDILEGGAGNDRLYGDAGNDTYVYNTGDGNDIISDTKGINSLVIDGQTISQITPVSVGSTSYQDAAGNQYEVNSLGWLVVTVGGDASAGRISIIGWDQDTNNFGVSMQELDNQSPEAIDDAGTSNENTPLIITVADLLSNDTDPEGDVLSLTSVNNGLNGTAVLDAVAGTITFTADAGYTGAASFDYTVSDGELTDVGTVNITVSAEANGENTNVSPDVVNFVGTSEDEVIYGSNLNDTVDGKYGDDTLYGFDGDDNLKGYVGNDLFVGGAGNDTLNGSLGSDTYLFNLGDGQDTISEYRSATDVNVIEFGPGITPDDLSFQKSSNGTSLEIIVGGGGDLITLQYFYSSSYDPSKPFIGEMRFDNRAVYTPSDFGALIPGLMSEGKDFIIGNADDNTFDALGGNDTVMGGAGNDSLSGGTGNDWLYGQAGDDTYHFQAGDGFDTIHAQSGSSETDFETLVFDDNFDVNNLWFTQKSNNLEIHLLGTNDKVRVYNWFESEQHELDQIQSGSGTIDNAGIEQLISSMAAFGTPSGGDISLSSEERSQVDTMIAAAWQS
jgi:Ca2+-binding RTX toxin-like protein